MPSSRTRSTPCGGSGSPSSLPAGSKCSAATRGGGYRYLPLAWTDLAPPDAFLSAAERRAALRPDKLLELADLLDRLKDRGA